MLTLPLLSALVGLLPSFTGAYGQAARTLIVIVGGIPIWALSFAVGHWLRAGMGWALALAFAGLIVSASAAGGYEHGVLSERGKEVSAQVTSKTVRHENRQTRYLCTLVKDDGSTVGPQLSSGDCRRVAEGQRVEVVVDPEGKVRARLRNRLGGDNVGMVLALVSGVLHALLLPVAAGRGRARGRADAARWQAAEAAPGGPFSPYPTTGPRWRPPPPAWPPHTDS